MTLQVFWIILACSFGSAIITFILVLLLKIYNKDYKPKKKDFLGELPLPTFLAGFIEIILYSTSILADMPEFIAVWLGVKTAIKWYRTDKKGETNNLMQRGPYLTYLFGTGLNIVFAFVSASLIKGVFIVF